MIRGLGPRRQGSNPCGPMSTHTKNEFKIKKNKISGKVWRQIWKKAQDLPDCNRRKAEKKTEMPFLREARCEKAIQGNLELQKMREKICIRYLLSGMRIK